MGALSRVGYVKYSRDKAQFRTRMGRYGVAGLNDVTREEAMSSIDVGAAVDARYKQLGLTQESLAWLAGVSHTTIRNVLHGRVSAARTWPRVERALGWNNSLKALSQGEKPEEILATSALKSLFTGILRVQEQDEARGQDALKKYEYMITMILKMETGWSNDAVVRSVIQELWPTVVAVLSPAEAEPLAEAFTDFGWRRPADPNIAAEAEKMSGHRRDLESSRPPVPLTEDLAQALEKIMDRMTRLESTRAVIDQVHQQERDTARLFQRLPVRVQQALHAGEVIDADVVQPIADEDISIVTMVVRGKSANEPLTAEDRRLLVLALRLWHMALGTSAVAYSTLRPHEWEPPADISERIEGAVQDAIRKVLEADPPDKEE